MRVEIHDDVTDIFLTNKKNCDGRMDRQTDKPFWEMLTNLVLAYRLRNIHAIESMK